MPLFVLVAGTAPALGHRRAEHQVFDLGKLNDVLIADMHVTVLDAVQEDTATI
ncbi:hypothetical protein [uncultured Sulfitobacter sp.]|uniref:hypothetical protein n=1 Tax=uncultured Sulfitobacter sp. TaxID=191468 RepID=UPI0030DCF44C